MLYYGASAIVNKILHPSHAYDLVRDIAPVAGLVDFPMVLVVHPSVPVRNVGELIAHAKANPGNLSMASFGTGTASHLAGESFKIMAGIDMVHVPFSGGAPMATGMVGGHVQVAFDVITTSLPHIRSGALRALGVVGRKRIALLPDIPSVSETLPDYEAGTWAGIGVPKGTPRDIIERLNREINAGLQDRATLSRLEDDTIDNVAGAVRCIRGGRNEKMDGCRSQGKRQARVTDGRFENVRRLRRNPRRLSVLSQLMRS
jgi:tripartite-type tricarboxylate transporter receptor subunit TctC